jgi:Rrf2 family protein
VLTKKGKYGLKAIVELGRLPDGRTMLLAEIAEANDIPKPFLEVILGELRQAGFVRSKKGRGGGYALARPASEIHIGPVVRALDGALAPISCASRAFYRRCEDCVDEDTCAVRRMMLDVRQAVSDVLDRRTVADMMGPAAVETLTAALEEDRVF